jgi:hypothetical protein
MIGYKKIKEGKDSNLINIKTKKQKNKKKCLNQNKNNSKCNKTLRIKIKTH